MDNSSKLRNIWKNYSNIFLLCILIATVSIITYYRVLIQIDIGPLPDSCDFLSNAYVFAGHQSYFDPSRPPFFSFLLSLIFKMGFTSTNTIFILDGFMFIIGVIGMFFLLKIQFNAIQSFLGALIYATFPTVLNVMSAGFSDLASVSITIWTFYFLILAVEKKSKYFYIVFPLTMLAFLTRYNTALIIFPIFLYILINRDKIKNNIKSIFAGIFISFLFLVPVFVFFNQKFGSIFYPFSSSFISSSNVNISGYFYYNPDLFFFIKKLPSFIGSDGISILLIIILGLFVIYVLKFNQKSERKLNLPKVEKSIKFKLMFFCILILLFIITFSRVNYVFSEILFFVLSYLLYDLLKSLKIKYIDIHLLFLAWFMVFFIFHSISPIKVDRYFVIMAPSITYFLILGLSEISNRIPFKIKKNNQTFPLLAVILTMLIFFSTAFVIPDIRQSNDDYKIDNEIINSANEWFINYDPDYKNKIIYSDICPYSGWYLKTNVTRMPIFIGNQKYNRQVEIPNLISLNNITYNNTAYNTELENNNVNYYFSDREGLNLTSYKPIKQFENLIIYKKIN